MIRRFKIEKNHSSSEALLSTQDPEIVYEIIRGVIYGIEKNKDSVDLFEIESGNDIQIFSIPKNKWKKALEKGLSQMIEMEDYETCSVIKKAMDNL